MRISLPQRSYTADGKRIEWTPAQYDRLQQLTGERAKVDLDALIRAGDWRSMSQETRQDEVDDLMKAARKAAKEEVLADARL